MVRGAKLHVSHAVRRDRGILIGPGLRLISVIAVPAIGFALGLPAVRPAVSVSETVQPRNFDPWHSSADVSIDPRLSSFGERFAGAFDWPSRRQTAETDERPNDIFLRSPDLGGHPASRHAISQSARLFPAPPPANVAKKQLRLAEALDEDSISPSDAEGHTAIYDIAAHTVYLPNGQKLEAHSGLGGHLDDARYVSEKDRGPTEPL